MIYLFLFVLFCPAVHNNRVYWFFAILKLKTLSHKHSGHFSKRAEITPNFLNGAMNCYIKLVLQLSEEQDYDIKFILEELESPINDKYMPNELILKVNELEI